MVKKDIELLTDNELITLYKELDKFIKFLESEDQNE